MRLIVLNAGKWDNSEIIAEKLKLSHELARLLGFNSYSEKSLATKMAQTPEQVLSFLNNLAERAKPQGEREVAELREYAMTEFGAADLEPWDFAFYSEKLKQHRYSISDEELRPYFPEQKVVAGLFEVLNRLFGMEIKPRAGVEVWDESVMFYDILISAVRYAVVSILIVCP